ncbi:hypothetical protein HWV07_07675 [Natronomonas salina]|uniref:DUF7344 domain-containing protein n=1 Tax=Natronomonas salina TaxID=1710540 RepID=UPI0015B4EBE6|nr:hypothetical protein [Natronomonas salina]QLD88914.1 hypothetical protein HWV07_07675 [Natronomonas salina]
MQLESSRRTEGRDRDELFEVLTHRRRRRVLALLRGADGPASLSEVAAELAADSECEDSAERVEITLYHRHVPKLAAAGLVAFDADRRTLTLTGPVPESVEEPGRTLEIE